MTSDLRSDNSCIPFRTLCVNVTVKNVVFEGEIPVEAMQASQFLGRCVYPLAASVPVCASVCVLFLLYVCMIGVQRL